ncbi:hypothetical protein JR050_09130 [Bacillus sp. RD4P76]|uniref:Uncharacterized protein n=1 Tax=Bacillus suaedaesalsae TaxID=2810349 RepID=A0ABS2DH74_9BACI|nr:hypothetical protein [Bacillus suaedaesalsae]
MLFFVEVIKIIGGTAIGGIRVSNSSWKDSYVGQLRELIGRKKLIHPSVRAK